MKKIIKWFLSKSLKFKIIFGIVVLLSVSFFIHIQFMKRKGNILDNIQFSASYSDKNDQLLQIFLTEDDKYRILYVSRMDQDRSAVAYMVADAMPEILKKHPNAELVIVGDGNDFERLKNHVSAINGSLNKRAIILTGARVDINKFVAASDVFVGVSRSALEAMAAGIPVVIA
ncbi:MAG: glycosyltransferase family 4 protein, partial [Treponema sp.]|nr:glycosyltransferase family 4 protein [Treponema sp.]